jgi:glucose/arabinose dehydrogenase
MRARHAIVAAAVALMLLPATASAASLVPLAPAHSFASEPVFATSPPGDPRVFIVERAGGIRIVKDGVLLPKPFLTVPNVDTEVERGLLSMAFPPDYASSGLFYVFTVAREADELDPEAEAGQIRIVEYHRSATNPDLAEPGSARLVFETEHSAGNHNGGQIMFGPEGLLYITIGDNAKSSNAQNVLNDFGKVLRIDPHDSDGQGGLGYTVPTSNPFFPEDIHSALYAIGLRNPYRASFGPNGELIVADGGANYWEEVDVGRPTGNPQATTLWGANLGWPECEGFCPSPPPKPGLTEPVFQYPHSGPSEETTGCAILGGYVVRDPRLTGLTGRYLYGDLCRKDLRTLNLGVPGADPQPAGVSIPSGNLRGFGEDSRGCVYVMTTGNAYRVAPSPDAGPACPPPPPPGPAADRTPPGLKLKAPRRERLRRTITVVATCNEACTLTATGRLRTSKARASAVCTAGRHRPGCPGPIELLRPASGAPSVPVKLHLKIRKRAFLHAKAARRNGRKVKALIGVTASDPSGNSRTLTAGIVLR